MKIPVRLETHPELRRRPEEASQPQSRVGRNGPLAEDDLVESIERNPEALRGLRLPQAERDEASQRNVIRY